MSSKPAARTNIAWRCIGALCLVLSWGAVLPVAAQVPSGKPTSQVASTRLVAYWSDQENALEDALQQRDAAGVTERLAADFEYLSTQPAQQLDAKAWRQLESRATSSDRLLRELQVRELGDTVVVSFVRVSGTRTWQAQWVVDVWRSADNKLQKRYSSPTWRMRAQEIRPDGRH